MLIWYIARGAGLAALMLLTVTTGLGALMSSGGRAAHRVVWQYVHRVTASVGLAALLLHVGSILADPWARVGVHGAFVPFASGYRPTAIALGTIAIYGVVLSAAVGMARGRIATSQLGARMWRWLHGVAYGAWALAMLHGIKSGTDTGVGWVDALYVACGAAVAGAITARFTDLGGRFAPREHANPPARRELAGHR